MIIRKVLLTDDLLKKIEEDKNRWLPKGLETGGYIFGKIFSNGLAQVTHIIDGGAKAKRTSISFSGDNEYATKVKDKLQKVDPEIRLLGEYHLHPWKGSPNPSLGDINQLKQVKKQRPWFILILITPDDCKVYDINIEYSPPTYWMTDHGCIFKPAKITSISTKDIPYQIVKTVAESKEKLLNRILKITKHELLLKKTVLIVGLGSGGSTVAKYLGCTGVGRIILVDNEELEVSNLIRHEGGVEDLGKPKVEICKKIIESHNPFTVVETYHFDVVKEFSKFEELASQADLIIGSSGSSKVNNLLNKISIEKKIPAVYGGVYEKALGGYVLAVKPFRTACFNCLFGLTSKSYSVDKEAAQRYGLSEDELHEQQGLWIDISFASLILCKMALAILQGEELDYNLILFDNKLEIEKLKVARRETCAVCNKEKWMKKVFETNSSRKKSNKLRFMKEKFRFLIGKLGERSESRNRESV